MIRQLPLPTAALVCLLALAGCSDASPSASSASGGASPSQTASFAGPAMPSEAQGESREAAEAFVRHWVETLNYATESGDTEGLKSLAAKDCSNCVAFAQTLDEVYGKDGHVDSDGWSLKSVVPQADRPEDQPAFQVTIAVPPQQVFASKDAKPETYPGGDQPARIALIREDDHWLVQTLDL